MSVRWLAPGVVELSWVGVIDAATILDAQRQIDALEPQSERVHAIVHDALGVSTYRPSVASPAVGMMSVLKKRGATDFVLVTASPTIRMMASTIAFTAGLSFRVVTDRASALASVGA